MCKLNKYDRHPSKPKMQPNVDIIEIQGHKFMSSIDKFLKFAKLFHIKIGQPFI